GTLLTARSEPATPLPPIPGTDETAPARAARTLTVANVMREEAMLFRVPAKGPLTFVRKLIHGEVLDLDAEEGERFAAVFASAAPHHLGFVAEKGNATWLLRVPGGEEAAVSSVIFVPGASQPLLPAFPRSAEVAPASEQDNHAFLMTLPGWNGSFQAANWPTPQPEHSRRDFAGGGWMGFTR
ncbi:MAG: hypothetical protein ACRC33_27565, partial [Gemmataceae bacterium]